MKQFTGKLRQAPKSSALGFEFSPSQEEGIQRAIRSATIFMQSYGKGRTPVSGGYYYADGEAPSDEPKGVWLTLSSAALYCGCTARRIEKAGQHETIRRRIYRRSGKLIYYEYLMEDLDTFIRNNKL